jgi:Tol biopolymer transport system component
VNRAALAMMALALLTAACRSGGAVGEGKATDLIPTSTKPLVATRGQITLAQGDGISQVAPGGRLRQIYVPPRGPHSFLSSPDWSLDGARLAFMAWTLGGSARYDGVRVLDVATGQDRRIVNCSPERNTRRPSPCVGFGGEGLDWSPDGLQIAFSNGSIWLVNSDGSGLHRLQTHSHSLDWAPSWSPDGTQLAFASIRRGAPYSAPPIMPNRPGGSSVDIVAADGTHRSQLAPDALAPAWSPDGREIAYLTVGPMVPGHVVPRTRRHCQVWERHPDGTHPIRLFTVRRCNPREWVNLAWSPDGREIVVGVAFVMNDHGGGVTPLNLPQGDFPMWSFGPSW